MMTTENPQKTMADYLAALRRYRGRMLGVGLVLLATSVGMAFGLPPVYRSSGTILIEQQEIPPDLVRSTITSFADQRIQVISQRVMTRANLADIIKKYDLYADDRKTEPMEVIIEQVREDIGMETVSADVVDPRSGRPTVATIAFRLSYDNESPTLAQKVANELISLYLKENLKNRTDSANETSSFLTAEVDKLAEHISVLEKKLAAFKSEHVNELPELMQMNLQLLDRTEREVVETDREMRSLRERRAYLDVQLAQVGKSAAVYTQNGERIMGPADRLKQLQTKYFALIAMYSADHPDVIRTRREIDALKADVGVVDVGEGLRERLAVVSRELAEARERYAPEHPDLKRLEREEQRLREEVARQGTEPVASTAELPDNPAYLQLMAQRESIEAELRTLDLKKKTLQARLAEYESRVARSPQVEREFRDLSRDYENAWAKYKDLKAKQMEAQLAQVMETERKGERFTLIEPPELPEKPLEPNRVAILALGMVFSVAGGLGAAAVSDSVDDTVRGARGITALLSAPPLASIPYIATAEERRRQRRRVIASIVIATVAVVGVAFGVHHLYMPLDVLWYAAQRRLGFL